MNNQLYTAVLNSRKTIRAFNMFNIILTLQNTPPISARPEIVEKLRNYNKLDCFYSLSASQNKAYSTCTKQHRDNPFLFHRPLAFPATGLFFCHALAATLFETANTWIQDST